MLNDVTIHPEGRPSPPPPSPEETVSLLERVRGGDDEALEALLIRLLPRLRRWAHGRLPASARGMLETADVVQSVASKAVRRLADIEVPHSAALGYYLRQAIANEIASEWRKAVRMPYETSVGESLPGAATSPLDRLIGAERMQRYEAALQRLAPAERETIVGRFELAYGYDDLARYLGKPSAGAARVAVHRAVKRLAEEAAVSDGSLVERLQQDVADRQHVDWAALLSELQAGDGASPDLLRDVSLLRLLDEIGQAHSTLQSEPLGDADAGPPVEAAADDTLKAWGRYVLEAKVGRGGFGSVYRAWDPVLEMPVALKILHRRYSDEKLKDRLLSEGRALAQLRHPNVVRVLNVEQHGGRFGLVMEFLSGETMDALIAEKGPLSDREASVIVEDVCRALVAVHGNGLIHRDVKARNIIREAAGRIVLMDFGAGLSVRASESPRTAVGTPLYMAPETLAGAPATPASDVYGVGVLLFYLVTARYPYEGASFDEIRDAHTSRRANSLLGLRPDLPIRFVKIVDRALALDVTERYQTPDALLQDLSDTGPGVVESPWARMRPGIYAGIALLVLMAVGGMLSSVAYNAALGRAAYQDDTLLQKFGWGAQALFLPIILTCLAAGLVGAVVAVRRVVIAASTGARELDRRLEQRGRSLCGRLALTDPAVCASWLLLVTAVVAGLIWTYWTPLLLAVTTDISFAPADMLAAFSPALEVYRTGYRMALSLLVAGNIAGWFVMRRATGPRVLFPVWIVATEVALVVLLLMSMQLPYRLLHHIEKADAVTWRGQQCYVVGKGPTDDLLYCSRMSPRIHVVPRTAVPLPPSSPKVHPFAPFSPASR